MGLNKFFEAIAIIVILAAITGHLPRLVREVQIAQLHLLNGITVERLGASFAFTAFEIGIGPITFAVQVPRNRD